MHDQDAASIKSVRYPQSSSVLHLLTALIIATTELQHLNSCESSGETLGSEDTLLYKSEAPRHLCLPSSGLITLSAPESKIGTTETSCFGGSLCPASTKPF